MTEKTVYVGWVTFSKDGRTHIHGTTPREFMAMREVDLINLCAEYAEHGWTVETIERKTEKISAVRQCQAIGRATRTGGLN